MLQGTPGRGSVKLKLNTSKPIRSLYSPNPDVVLKRASDREVSGWEAQWDHEKTAARLAWIEAIRVVYAAALDLLGIGAPERMDRPKDETESPDDDTHDAAS